VIGLLEGLAGLLISKGIYARLGTDIFLDGKPDTPARACCLFEYAGSPVEPGADCLDRKVQILTRDSSYAAAKAKAWAIFSILAKPEDPEDILQLDADRWAVVSALAPPVKLEEDDKKRTVFVCNYIVTTQKD
jgi:hypothetical protein